MFRPKDLDEVSKLIESVVSTADFSIIMDFIRIGNEMKRSKELYDPYTSAGACSLLIYQYVYKWRHELAKIAALPAPELAKQCFILLQENDEFMREFDEFL